MLIYKFLISFMMPPGLFIILIILSLILLNYKKPEQSKKRNAANILLVFTAVTMYLVSIEPVKDILCSALENKTKPLSLEKLKEGDSIIVLGGGVVDYAPVSFETDKKNFGTPSYAAMARLTEAVRIYNRRAAIDGAKLPVILSGGMVFSGYRMEAAVYKGYIMGLGVSENNIIIEGRARTTFENAKYSVELLKKYNFQKPILVTSATHMKRSVNSFKKFNRDVIPAPADYQVSGRQYDIFSYIPNSGNIEVVKKVLWELAGEIYYNLKSK